MNFQNFLEKNNFHAFMHRKSSKYPGLNDESNNIIQSITGLESSDGFIIVSLNKSALFVDGRYLLSAKLSIDQNKFEILDLKKDEIRKWIKKNILQNSNIAYDPEFFTWDEMESIKSDLKDYNFIPTEIKNAFHISVAKRNLKIYRLENAQTSDEKMSTVYDIISTNKLDAYLICDPCTIAWLLNIRDFGRKHTPVVLGYLLITSDKNSVLYLDGSYNANYSKHVKGEEILQNDLDELDNLGIDKSETPSHIKHRNLIHLKNPSLLAKSMKNASEINDLKSILKEDSMAIINFLYWFHNNPKNISELEAAQKLLYFRKLQKHFVSESFETIAAADEHAAIVHYSPNPKSNKIIENILLLDSGGQYKYGTTDITRTVSLRDPTDEQKLFYTLVLKGHIALASAKFPIGTTGAQLDPLARQFLWQYSSDYNHSTGHGIGYALNVHEGPIAIFKTNNVPLQAGMILSNEPGYYRENSFGIRLENMMLVQNEPDGFLSFETISLVPFDLKFINKKLLNADEISWLEAYNNKIISSLDLPQDMTQFFKL